MFATRCSLPDLPFERKAFKIGSLNIAVRSDVLIIFADWIVCSTKDRNAPGITILDKIVDFGPATDVNNSHGLKHKATAQIFRF